MSAIYYTSLILGKVVYNIQWMRLHSTGNAYSTIQGHQHCNIGYARFEGLKIKIFVNST